MGAHYFRNYNKKCLELIKDHILDVRFCGGFNVDGNLDNSVQGIWDSVNKEISLTDGVEFNLTYYYGSVIHYGGYVIMDCPVESIDPNYVFAHYTFSTPSNYLHGSYYFDAYPNYVGCGEAYNARINPVISQAAHGSFTFNGVVRSDLYVYCFYPPRNLGSGSSNSGKLMWIANKQSYFGDGVTEQPMFISGGGNVNVYRVVSQLTNIDIAPDYSGGAIMPNSGNLVLIATPASGYQWETTPIYPSITIGGHTYNFSLVGSDVTCSIPYADITNYGTIGLDGFYELNITGGQVEPIPVNVYDIIIQGSNDNINDYITGTLPTQINGGQVHTFVYTLISGYMFDYAPDFDYPSGLDGISATISADGTVMTLTIDTDLYIATARQIGGGEYLCSYDVSISAIPPEDTGIYHIWKPTKQNIEDINDALFINYGTNDPNDVISNFIAFKQFYCTFEAEDDAIFMAGKYKYNGITCDYIITPHISISCGSITINAVNNDIRDYEPYCKAVAYLPFIGFVNLDVNIIMGNTLTLIYNVDVLSGQCVALIYVSDNGDTHCIGTYDGTIAYDIPMITNGDYKGIPTILSSQLLGEFVPYIEIYYNDTFGSIGVEGNYSSDVIKVGDVTGFIKYKEMKVSGINATQNELKEIESWLLKGVVV